MVHGVGNNLIKVWLSTADKEAVAKTKSFLVDILDAEDYVTDKVTFVPHKLVLPSNNQKIPTSGATPPESCPLHVCVFFVSVHYFPHFQRPYRIPQKTWQQQLRCLGCFLFFFERKGANLRFCQRKDISAENPRNQQILLEAAATVPNQAASGNRFELVCLTFFEFQNALHRRSWVFQPIF